MLSQDILFTLICLQCLHHGFDSLHASQFVGFLFARFVGISLGPESQDTRHNTTQQHTTHKTTHQATRQATHCPEKQKMDLPLELSIG
jgi:hypothetical protein